MDIIKKYLKKYKEIISYLFWGVMTTVVSWVSYSIFVTALQSVAGTITLLGMEMSLSITIANALSWIVAVVFAYITNKLWVFNSKSFRLPVVLPEFGKFLSARIITGVLEIVAVPFLVAVGLSWTIFGVEGMVAKVIVSVAVVILNYVFSKLFIFKKKS